MNSNESIIKSITGDGKNSRRYWLRVFVVYAMAEMLYFAITYATTRIMCGDCTLYPAFYISQWAVHLVFTVLLWYCLNLFYHKPIWMVGIINIFVFAIYYFLWLATAYGILYTSGEWLLGVKKADVSFAQLVNGSWFEIGKYVLKLTIFYILKFYYEYRKAEQQRIRLSVVNKDMQLNLLKQQLSPHFYFNTLNNLYGLARSNNSKLSPALHQLSNIMQYVLVDCNCPKVLLKQEISFLESYISLEKFRYEKGTVIEMNVKGDANGQTIMPLLLVQFVENAFKHGMKEKSSSNWVKIGIVVAENEMLFTVNNSCEQAVAADGIGISSVKDILQLQYEGKHDLQIQQQAGYFSVILKLNLQ
jgi:two-component system, LytTR family, sensor kinase